MKSITQQISEIRKRSGESLRSIEKKTGIPNQYISKIERGLNSPSVENLQKILNALDKHMVIVDKNSECSQMVVREEGVYYVAEEVFSGVSIKWLTGCYGDTKEVRMENKDFHSYYIAKQLELYVENYYEYHCNRQDQCSFFNVMVVLSASAWQELARINRQLPFNLQDMYASSDYRTVLEDWLVDADEMTAEDKQSILNFSKYEINELILYLDRHTKTMAPDTDKSWAEANTQYCSLYRKATQH